jgi:hypothetical protein
MTHQEKQLGLILVLSIPLFAFVATGGCGNSGTDGDADGDSDGDADGDSDSDGDADGDSDGDGDGDADGDSDGDADGDGDADWATCSVPSDCGLAWSGCCHPCGLVELEHVDGVNGGALEVHFAEVCPEPPAEGCSRCATELNPWIFATCRAGYCLALDLREEAETQCAGTGEDQCVVRARDCCECGADTSHSSLVALAASEMSAFLDIVCDPGTGCDDCVPDYPTDVSAMCNEAGRCELVFFD